MRNKPTLTLSWTGRAGYTVPSEQVTFVSSTQVQMSITTTTAPDNWTVKVTNPDGKVSNTAGFAVVAPTNAAPTISSVSPNPVTGFDGPQLFTIIGGNFQSNANVTLRDKTYVQSYPNRLITSFASNQLQLRPNFSNNSATWSVEVINPDGKSSGEFTFTVVRR